MFRVGGSSHSRLPDEMLHMISKYLGGDEDSLSLALSERLQGFASFYAKERGKYGLILGPGCYFLKPSSWDTFFTRYICPESITKFNANHSYWIPGQWLCDQILTLENLQDVSIRDTKISLPQLARLLEISQKITKLDFSYHHEEGFLKALVEQPLSAPVVIEAFKRLTSLKITTSVLDAKDYLNDPWIFITIILSWCKNCIELTVDIYYDGETDEYQEQAEFSPYEAEIERYVQEILFPRLIWMKSLQKLALTNHGFSSNFGGSCVRSRLLDLLLSCMFSNDPRPPLALTHLWVQRFYFPIGLLNSNAVNASLMKAFRADMSDGYSIYRPEFRDLEHLSWIELDSLDHLQHLKSVHGSFSGEPQQMLDFIRTHPNLEHMTIHYTHINLEEVAFYVPNSVLQLLKLKTLSCSSLTITKEMVDDFVKVYPNLETISLKNLLTVAYSTDDTFQIDEECLTGIRFKSLTSITLSGFHINGSFLKSMITNCPRLERVHLEGNTISTDSSFILNLDLFLVQATKLKDLRLQLDLERANIADASFVLKSLLSCASHLERLVIYFEDFPDINLNHPFTGLVVDFAKKMERLVALCLSFGRRDDDHSCWSDSSISYEDDDAGHDALIEQINHRIAQEVLPTRPVLWFYLDSDLPDSKNTPLLHYRDMLIIDPWNPPLEF